MKRLLLGKLLISATVAVAVLSINVLSADAVVLNIPSLGSGSAGSIGGWFSDDTRSDGTAGVAGSTNLIGVNNTINTATHGAIYTGQPAGGGVAPSHDTAIDAQIIFGAAPGTPPVSTWGGAVNLKSSDASPNTKSQIASIVDGTFGVGGGHAAGNVLVSGATFEYSWFGQGTSTQTPSLKFGIKTTDFGSTGSSSRTGENAWDKVLVYEPNQQVPPETSDSTWRTEIIDFTNGTWQIFDRTTFGGGVGGPKGTLNDWATDNTTLFDSVNNGADTMQTIYNKIVDANSVITSVQFGIGSSATLGDVFVNQLDVSFLNGGDTITFGTEAEAPVPEPGSLALLSLGLIGFAARRRRRR